EDAFEGGCSLRDIGAVETNEKRPLKSYQIAKNIDKLKRKLKKNKSPLYQSLHSGLIRELEDDELRDSFMEPKRKMVPGSLPTIVQRKEWKESGPELANVTEKILDSLDAWNNPAFSPEFEELQNEGTYVNNVILPAICAALKCLPLRKSTYVSSSERKSNASADRKG
ncbi:4300_t:CDS:2, partial [Dentiscutata heterogama]